MDADSAAATARPPSPAARVPFDPRAQLELLRLPNWFTAVADVTMGYLLMQAGVEPRLGLAWGLLVATSLALYAAGMVLNDVFDFEIDARQRPGRPLPSGRIERNAAQRLGWRLLAGGVALGGLASLQIGSPRSGLVAIGLATCVWLYDGVLKTTPVAPVVMGACRGLNVLLGMSAFGDRPWEVSQAIVAGGVAIYIAGVTWFARSEAGASSRVQLLGGVGLMLLGMAALATLPVWFGTPGQETTPLALGPREFPLVIVGLGALLAWRWAWALVEPEPPRVQAAVRLGIWNLILLDAAVVWACHGPFWGSLVALLLVPTALLGRWLYAT